MDIKDEKRQLFEYLTVHAIPVEEYEKAVTTIRPAVEHKYIERWKKQFYDKEKDFTLPDEPRLVNRFMLGADPEFLMGNISRATGELTYIFAEDLGLTTTMCFGSDMSGRQAELRAAPSRFALDVVASLLETLRWMAFMVPDARVCAWQATAYIQNGDRRDGFGGHVHFGRRRKDLLPGIIALDNLMLGLLKLDVLDKAGQQLRMEYTNYGRTGDYRTQYHGFEYRSMPSWINNPQTAHFVLTISKLAMIDKRFTADLMSSKNSRQVVINWLKKYRYQDDDARIAMRAIEIIGFPKYMTHYDFKGEWGISSELSGDRKGRYFPHVVEGSAATKQQLFDWLVKGQKIIERPPVCTWEPEMIPEGFHTVKVSPHVMGIPEIAQGLVCNKWTVLISGNQVNKSILFTVDRAPGMPSASKISEEMQKYPQLQGMRAVVKEYNGLAVNLNLSVCRQVYNHDDGVNKDVVEAIRKLLTSGLFPIAKGKDMDTLKNFVFEKKIERQVLRGRIALHIQGDKK